MNKNKNNKKKRWKIIVPIAVVIIILFAAVGKSKGSSTKMTQEVETAKAVKADIKAALETSGTIGSEDIRSYSSPVTAKVKEVNIQTGDTVEKGDFLLTYDTSSLEKSYTISELQAKAENAVNEKSLEMSAKGSTEAAEADASIQSLQGQIDTLNSQIADLSSQIANSQNTAARAAELEEEIAGLNKSIESLSEKENLTKEQQKELKTLEGEKQKKEEELKAFEASMQKTGDLESQLATAQTQMESLQGSMAEEKAKKEAGEAAVLTEAEKQGIQSSAQAARLTLSQSKDALSSAKAGITAEFNGIVTTTEITAGSMAQEGMTMFSVADASKMCVDFQLSKYNLQSVEKGQKVTITSLGKTYQGSISSIGKIAEKTEAGAAMAKARVHIDNPDDSLIIGLDAELKVQLGSKKDVLAVPMEAVNTDTKGDFVYVLEKGKVKQKYVTTGISSKKQIEITEGLKEGEEVITTIDSSITDGMDAVAKKDKDKKE